MTYSQSLFKLLSIASVMPSNHLILYRPFLLLLSVFPSIRVLSNKSVLCITCPKYFSFSFSISPSSEYSGLIFFRIDWFDLLAVQGTLKSLLPPVDILQQHQCPCIWGFPLDLQIDRPKVCVRCVQAQSLSHVWLFATPWIIACQAPLSMEFFTGWLMFSQWQTRVREYLFCFKWNNWENFCFKKNYFSCWLCWVFVALQAFL